MEPAMPKISCLDVEVMLSELPDGKANHVIKIVNFEVRHFSLTFLDTGFCKALAESTDKITRYCCHFAETWLLVFTPVSQALSKFEAACREKGTIATYLCLQDGEFLSGPNVMK